MKLKVNTKQKLDYANPGDAGLDIQVDRVISNDGNQIIYGTGVKAKIPEGHVGFLMPRSSVRKYDLMMKNSVGTIDSGYTGEIQATFIITSNDPKLYKAEDKCCQLVIVPFVRPEIEYTEDLGATERGEKGHGSSGE